MGSFNVVYNTYFLLEYLIELVFSNLLNFSVAM